MQTAQLIILIVIAIFSLLAVYVMVSFIVSIIYGSPFVRTPKNIAREMLKLSGLKTGQTIIDLGSGDGTLLIMAVREFGAKKAIGYEINYFLAMWTLWRAAFNNANFKVAVKWKNIFKAKLEKADVITIYLLPKLMRKLSEQLKTASPGTRIVSHGFEFPGIKPRQVKKINKSTLYLYTVEDLKRS